MNVVPLTDNLKPPAKPSQNGRASKTDWIVFWGIRPSRSVPSGRSGLTGYHILSSKCPIFGLAEYSELYAKQKRHYIFRVHKEMDLYKQQLNKLQEDYNQLTTTGWVCMTIKDPVKRPEECKKLDTIPCLINPYDDPLKLRWQNIRQLGSHPESKCKRDDDVDPTTQQTMSEYIEAMEESLEPTSLKYYIYGLNYIRFNMMKVVCDYLDTQNVHAFFIGSKHFDSDIDVTATLREYQMGEAVPNVDAQVAQAIDTIFGTKLVTSFQDKTVGLIKEISDMLDVNVYIANFTVSKTTCDAPTGQANAFTGHILVCDDASDEVTKLFPYYRLRDIFIHLDVSLHTQFAILEKLANDPRPYEALLKTYFDMICNHADHCIEANKILFSIMNKTTGQYFTRAAFKLVVLKMEYVREEQRLAEERPTRNKGLLKNVSIEKLHELRQRHEFAQPQALSFSQKSAMLVSSKSTLSSSSPSSSDMLSDLRSTSSQSSYTHSTNSPRFSPRLKGHELAAIEDYNSLKKTLTPIDYSDAAWDNLGMLFHVLETSYCIEPNWLSKVAKYMARIIEWIEKKEVTEDQQNTFLKVLNDMRLDPTETQEKSFQTDFSKNLPITSTLDEELVQWLMNRFNKEIQENLHIRKANVFMVCWRFVNRYFPITLFDKAKHGAGKVRLASALRRTFKVPKALKGSEALRYVVGKVSKHDVARLLKEHGIAYKKNDTKEMLVRHLNARLLQK
jgi:hypothetical protein